MKRALIWLLLLLCLLPLVAQGEETAPRGWLKGQGYQYVLLGEYPYEKDGTVQPVLWRILEVQDDQMLLLTEYVIDTSQVIFETDQKVIDDHSFRRISSYAESDLYGHLNTTVLDTLLGDDPIRNTLIEEPGGGELFILNTMQFLNPNYGFSATRWNEQKSRWAGGTPYAVERGLYTNGSKQSTYWVADIKSPEGYMMQLVGYNGHLSYGGYTRTNVGMRLSMRLDLTRLTIVQGSGTQEEPFVFACVAEELTEEPTEAPTVEPIPEPIIEPTGKPTVEPAAEPTEAPTAEPISDPVAEPTEEPTAEPTEEPAEAPTAEPIPDPVAEPAEEPTVEPTAEPAPEQADADTVTISFIGDCSVGDSIQYRGYGSSYHSTLAANGYAWPFSLVKQYLEADDLTVANLEVVFTTRTSHTDKLYNLIADPAHVQTLVEGSIEMVNTVNNHAMDFYAAGYQDTLDTLDAAGIGHFGSINVTQDNGFDHLGIQEVGGLRIGFVGFTYPQIQSAEQKRIVPRIQKLKEEEGCDLVVVSLHWGKEESLKPVSSQYKSAKLLIDGGADVIWGHHPHVIQPIEFYKGKPIFYSTGNFTFGTMSLVDPATGIFQLTYEKVDGAAALKRLEVIPCRTQGSGDFRPYVLTEEADRQAVFKKLMSKRNAKGFENPPESFLTTGVIEFENGQILP